MNYLHPAIPPTIVYKLDLHNKFLRRVCSTGVAASMRCTYVYYNILYVTHSRCSAIAMKWIFKSGDWTENVQINRRKI